MKGNQILSDNKEKKKTISWKIEFIYYFFKNKYQFSEWLEI